MSKTYTLTASVSGKRGSVRSSTLVNYTENYSGKYIGSTGSTTQYACILNFSSDALEHLQSIDAVDITSITLKVMASTGASGPFHTYYGIQKAAGSAEITSSHNVAISKKSTSVTIDVTGLGLPSTDAYCIGSQTNTSGETYATMRGISAELTVVTAETDYTLSYDANGGSGAPASQTATDIGSHEFTISMTEPTRTGYTFLGWSTSSSATTASYQPGDLIEIAANTTLYAVWSIIKYNLTFEPGTQTGTSGHTYTLIKNYEVTAYLLNISDTDIVRTGYHATGWATTDGGAAAYSFGKKYTANASITLYPAWAANEYTVSFDSQGGSAESPITVTYGSTYGTLPTPTRTGYTFNGWFTAASGGTEITAASTVSILDDQTLYAHWTANTYTVTYTDGITPHTQSITYDTPWTVEAFSFTKTGHTQVDWNTSPDGDGDSYIPGAAISAWENLTLYAIFTANTYTLTFDSHGGSAVASKTVTYGQPYGTLPPSQRARYRFDGWYTEEAAGNRVLPTDIFVGISNETLHAHWTLLETTQYHRCNVYIKRNGRCIPVVIGNMSSGHYRRGQTYFRITMDGGIEIM